MTTALVKAGRSVRHQIAFATRRRIHGPSGRRTRTHCWRGHKWTAANSYIDAHGYRHCEACRDIREGRQRRVSIARARVIAAHPDHGGSRTKLQKALKAYKAA